MRLKSRMSQIANPRRFEGGISLEQQPVGLTGPENMKEPQLSIDGILAKDLPNGQLR
jgi:hypothetical protein